MGEDDTYWWVEGQMFRVSLVTVLVQPCVMTRIPVPVIISFYWAKGHKGVGRRAEICVSYEVQPSPQGMKGGCEERALQVICYRPQDEPGQTVLEDRKKRVLPTSSSNCFWLVEWFLFYRIFRLNTTLLSFLKKIFLLVTMGLTDFKYFNPARQNNGACMYNIGSL